MVRSFQPVSTFIVMLFVLLTGAAVNPVQAQSGQRCFPETNQCISGPIRAYWERNGGLPIFGYPITAQRMETVEGRTLPVQWFERDRLEDHGSIGVLAGRLGARFLELEFVPWEYFTRTTNAPAGCQFFAQTGQALCEPYLSYWRNNGGLERFGYPITHQFYEHIEDKYLPVQYFERRRMEIHSELPGSPILLGLLGNGVSRWPAETTARYPACLQSAPASLVAMREKIQAQIGTPLGCPVGFGWEALPASTQQFERGEMIWLSERPGARPVGGYPPTIFALSNPGPRVSSASDTWVAGQDPETAPGTPPRAGLYAPWRGFGKFWTENPDVRERIGWATESQAQPRTVDTQLFQTSMIIRINETGVIYALGNRMNGPEAYIIAP